MAFVPSSGLSTFTGTSVTNSWRRQDSISPHRRADSKNVAKMSAYPYTGSGYGAAGVGYGGDKVGQSFKQTTTEDIVQTAASVPIFNTLVSLLRETGLDYELAKGGPFTVFAPTDDAFASLLEPHGFAKLGPLLRPENREDLKKLLSYHVVRGNISASSIIADGQVTGETLAGVSLTMMGYGKKVSAGTALVIKGDVPCTNGVIHVINSVLCPDLPELSRGPEKKLFFQSTVQDVYANLLTPREALGIDPLPAGADSTALTK